MRQTAETGISFSDLWGGQKFAL